MRDGGDVIGGYFRNGLQPRKWRKVVNGVVTCVRQRREMIKRMKVNMDMAGAREAKDEGDEEIGEKHRALG